MSIKRKQLLQKKCLMLISFIMIISLVPLSFKIRSNAKATKEVYTYYKTIEIKTGDTLNEIASRYNNNDIQDSDEYIYKVKDLNHIPDGKITSGENLVVPYYSSVKK
jgi:LysM repeat protein